MIGHKYAHRKSGAFSLGMSISFIPNFQNSQFQVRKKWMFYHGKCWLKIVYTACGIFNIAQSGNIHHTMVIVQLNSKYEVFYDLTI